MNDALPLYGPKNTIISIRRILAAILQLKFLTSTVSLPSLTAVSSSPNIVSNPGYPGGGFSAFFSSHVCGAKIKYRGNSNKVKQDRRSS